MGMLRDIVSKWFRTKLVRADGRLQVAEVEAKGSVKLAKARNKAALARIKQEACLDRYAPPKTESVIPSRFTTRETMEAKPKDPGPIETKTAPAAEPMEPGTLL